MRTIITAATAALALLLHGSAGAQTTVYETHEADGDVSFSDTSSPGSEEVEIQRTDVVHVAQPEQREAQPEGSALPRQEDRAQGGGGENMQVIHDAGYDDGGAYVEDAECARRGADCERRAESEPGVDTGDREERRMAEGAPGAVEGETRAEDATPGLYGGGAVGKADAAAERSDITPANAEYGHPTGNMDVTGPNAEYRQMNEDTERTERSEGTEHTERTEHVEGGEHLGGRR